MGKTPKRDTRQSELGQFMTPEAVARFMVSLFPASPLKICRVLDAGAGEGALSCAFLDRWKAGGFGFQSVEATAFEIDDSLSSKLRKKLAAYENVNLKVFTGDFIELSAEFDDLFSLGSKPACFTHAILNPPYRKINSSSVHRKILRRLGIDTVNLYSAFVSLALRQVEKGGHIITIIPRSFCNGPYYRAFRDFILREAAIRRVHLFESRSRVFNENKVLQENVIIHLERGGLQGDVVISKSTDREFLDLKSKVYPVDQVVLKGESGCFIRIPKEGGMESHDLSFWANHSLADLAIKVSTGPVVDFRMRDYIRNMPEAGTVPLIYPCHLNPSGVEWPSLRMKKPNAIVRSSETEKWLHPNGFYCVVRRFSSKEERKRIVANVVDPSLFESYEMIGFENHLNFFHENGRGLPEPLARGLALFLNANIVDGYFREFNGHTQVNAADLKFITYPDRDTLLSLGNWAMQQKNLTQDAIDAKINSIAA